MNMQKLKCQFQITNNTLLFKIDEQEGFPDDFEFAYNGFKIIKRSCAGLYIDTISLRGSCTQDDNKIAIYYCNSYSALKDYCGKIWATLEEFFDINICFSNNHNFYNHLYYNKNTWLSFTFTKDTGTIISKADKTDVKSLWGKCIRYKEDKNIIRTIADVDIINNKIYLIYYSTWLNKEELKNYQYADTPDGEWKEFNL